MTVGVCPLIIFSIVSIILLMLVSTISSLAPTDTSSLVRRVATGTKCKFILETMIFGIMLAAPNPMIRS